ncbi:hypothetical protein MUCCIDRAFT_161268 [Mucor lusitanicus CBS 277.49]|uniref:RRM domain-containing protein n=1 Tax=Mucor lusitanicus CBS 277.49 TaxID=747725 RepID=A0A168M858_MUCCL|nr:hypothetical protein MUCCIDRAFT_161268 [Mucor lusitanicus CBS 277.49]
MPQDKGKRGFGFVSYSKSVEAAHAILSMNQTDDMVVRFHEPKVPRKEHNFEQQLAYLSDSELAMHFYTRPLDNSNSNKMMPLTTTNKATYMPTGMATAAAAATAIPYYYYHHPHPSLYYHHHPPMYAPHASPPLTQDQYIQMKLLDMLNYIKIDMSNQEREIVQQQLTRLDLNEQYACINDALYFQQKISTMLAVYSDSHGAK